MKIEVPKTESRYLHSDDIGQTEVIWTINRVEQVMVNQNDGEKEKVIIGFQQHAKPIVLNITNTITLIEYLGDESDNWLGKPLTIYTVPTQDKNGRPCRGIRVKAPHGSAVADINSANNQFAEDAYERDERAAIQAGAVAVTEAKPQFTQDDMARMEPQITEAMGQGVPIDGIISKLQQTYNLGTDWLMHFKRMGGPAPAPAPDSNPFI